MKKILIELQNTKDSFKLLSFGYMSIMIIGFAGALVFSLLGNIDVSNNLFKYASWSFGVIIINALVLIVVKALLGNKKAFEDSKSN